MILENLDKYIRQADVVDRVNAIGRITDVYELVEYILSGNDLHKQKVLSMLDRTKRAEVEKLIDGGIL